MPYPILSTKLFTPSIKPLRVLRPRLLELLDGANKHKVTLISAPPGFGKTTLLAEWLSARKIKAAWLSLDEEDNDFVRFLNYFINAIQQAEPSIGNALLETLNETQRSPDEQLLVSLINDCASLHHPMVVILDDYHLIINTDVQKAMFFLVSHLPENVHLIISTRSDPPWKLGKLRSSQEMMEIRAHDLRFTKVEISQFFNQVMRLNLIEDDISAMEVRTEGWIASLQMAAVSMQKADDIHAFVASFTGSDRVVFDYLIEEVLHAQPPTIESFLLKTSVLELFDAEMCNFVLNRTDSQAVLTNLENSNLFLFPMDADHRQFRYHHLFSELLRVHLLHDDPLGALTIHKRAAEWKEKHSDPLGALQHYLSAKDLTNAIRTAEQNTLSLLDNGQISEVNSWLNTIPQPMIVSSPWLSVARAWALVYFGKTEAMESLLQQAERHLLSKHSGAELERIRGHIASLRAYAQWMLGNPERGIELSKEALALLPENDCMALSQVYVTLGLSQQNCFLFDEAEKTMKLGIECSRHLLNSHIRVLSVANLGFLYSLQGKFDTAEQLCLDLLEEFRLPDGSYRRFALANPLATLCMINTFTGRAREAIPFGEEAVRLARQWQQMDTLHYSLTCLDTAYLLAGENKKADEILKQAKAIAQGISTWWQSISERQEIIRFFLHDQTESLQAWLKNRGDAAKPEEIQENFDSLQAYVRVLVMQGKYQPALELTRKLMEFPDDDKLQIRQVSVLADMALALNGLGRETESTTTLEKALRMAEPIHYVYPFLLKGKKMKELLHKWQSHSKCSTFIAVILNSFQQFSSADESKSFNAQLPEPLTAREIDILRMLDSSKSSNEIAVELIVAVSTVRTHIKSIYRKLDVNHRIDAIQKAKKLGFLT